MIKIKLLVVTFILIVTNNIVNSSVVEIKVKINNEIITNIDITNEKKYLTFLNPKLMELDNLRIEKIAKDSLITEIIKRNELKKYFDLNKSQKVIGELEKRIMRNKNINNKSDFLKIIKKNNLNYKVVKSKLQIEALWNQLIYKKYMNNVKINNEGLKKEILDQYNDKKKIYEYNLSEIVFKESPGKTFEDLLNEIMTDINEVGFENSANINSISNTSKKGGLIGWINELQLSKKINEEIKNLELNKISRPIKIQNGYILLKLNNKKEFKQEFNLDEQLKKLINEERNYQLNNFSIIFYKKLKKNIEINEY